MVIETRRVPLSKVVIDDAEIERVVRVLKSGNLREGAECRAFEDEFARHTVARFALTASSGTSALQMAYQAVIEPGDEVLVPAFTFFASASMVVAAGGTPVFCDIDPETLTIDVMDAAARITPRTRALAPVHLFGNSADVKGIRELADARGLRVVWDAAQAHGTLFDGTDVGCQADVVCYSFYPSKNMTTGEGGMVCTNSEEVANRIKLLRSQGQPRKYYHTTLGYNFRMTDIQAAIGRGQLEKLRGWVERRRENAEYLRERLADCPGLTVQREEKCSRHSYHQFSLLVDPSLDRDEVMDRVRNAGVDCAVHYPIPLNLQPFFAQRRPQPDLPVSQDVAERIFSVPVHPHLSASDREWVAKALREAVS